MDLVAALKQLTTDGRISQGWSCGETIDSILLSSTDTPLSGIEIIEAYNKWKLLNSYKINRRSAYPSIPDQLDMIFHNGIDAWKAQIQAIKDRYPKPQ